MPMPDKTPTDRDLLVRIDVNTERLVELGDRAVTALEAGQIRKDIAAKARQKLLATVADRVLQPRVVGVLSMAAAVAIVAYAIAGTGLTARVSDYFEIGPAEAAADAGSDLDSPPGPPTP